MKYTNCKIRIKNKKHGLDIQRALFANDITWVDSGKTLSHRSMKYLVTCNEGHMYYGYDADFNCEKGKVITLEDIEIPINYEIY